MDEKMTMDDVREPVQKFAMAMECVLRKHDREKGYNGWTDANNIHLIKLLKKCTNDVDRLTRQIAPGAVDAANVAMMLWDNNGATHVVTGPND